VVTEVGVDPRFERAVLAELALSGRRVRRHDRSQRARDLAHRLHRGRHDLLARWCHRSPDGSVLHRACDLSDAPGVAGRIARVVARAAIQDLLDDAHPDGETRAALALLPDPRLTA